MDFLVNNLNLFEFPSSLWGFHIDPELKYMGILHMSVNSKKIQIDKGVLFCSDDNVKSIKASTFLDGKEIFLNEKNCSINEFSEVNQLLVKLESVHKCTNFDNEEHSNCMQFTYGEAYCENCLGNRGLKLEVTETEDIELLIEYGCFHCDSMFKSSRALKIHLKKHDLKLTEENNETTCDVCGIALKVKNVSDHKRTHGIEKPFQCKFCKKTFAKRYNLKMHENIHMAAKPFMCNHCGKSFSAQSNLKSHIMYSHEHKKKHVCQICSKAFIHPRYLRIHMRKHTGEKPFPCVVCGRDFAQNAHRKVHMRTHTGEKPYTCEICNKGFITSGNLDCHKKYNHKELFQS